jgi:RsiW-degrading membrane proteinase PrsW (M82 family)
MFLFYVNPILIAAAIIPAIVLLRFVYKEDRLDKESPGLLLSLVIFGILSTFAAIVTEQIGEAILGILLPQSSTAYNVLLYFVVVALSEEGFKYLLLKKRTWYSGEFNCQFDGIVYAVFVALGFALWENISYVLMYGLGTAAVRAVTAVPGHACFGVFMGAFYGLAKRYDNFGDEYRSRRCQMDDESFSRRCRRFAVLVPVLLHGAYDFIATYEYDGYAWIFVVFVVLLFAAAYRMIKKLSRDDHFIGDSDYYHYDGPEF